MGALTVFWGDSSRRSGQSVWSRAFLSVFVLVAFFSAPLKSLAGEAKGKLLATRPLPNLGQSCVSCHGAMGEGLTSRATPKIAGLPRHYILHELDLFASRKRVGVMQIVAKNLSSQDRQSVAAYFAKLPSRRQPPVFHPASSWGLGERLAREGRLSAGIPACFLCHGPKGMGIAPSFPPVAGLSAGYIGEQLAGFKSGIRSGDPEGLMVAVAKKLSPSDIRAVSRWLSGGPDLPGPPLRHHGMVVSGSFLSPDWDGGPPGPYGDAVRYGRKLFYHTAQVAPEYAKNGLSCAACHLSGGTLANAAPLWAAFLSYPVYRNKNHAVVTYGQRLRDCFMYSLNGKKPALDSKEIISLEAYSKWVSDGAPIGVQFPGRGFPALNPRPRTISLTDGQMVYEHSCALCHGPNGQGLKKGKEFVFPPLWGTHSFNCGAGLHLVAKAASFIQRNMPLGNAGTLSVRQAWDVAEYIESRPHPVDPRKRPGFVK